MVNIPIANLEELSNYAKQFAIELNKEKQPVIIGLAGELGSGKTTFVQKVAKELGVKATVKSPTFIIHSEYKGNSKAIHHLDLYRLEEKLEVDELNLQKYLDKNTLMFIEWANKFSEIINNIPVTKIWIDFETVGEKQRIIKFYEQKE